MTKVWYTLGLEILVGVKSKRKNVSAERQSTGTDIFLFCNVAVGLYIEMWDRIEVWTFRSDPY